MCVCVGRWGGGGGGGGSGGPLWWMREHQIFLSSFGADL